MTGLDATELYKFYHAGGEEVMALRGVTLEVASGEYVSLLGPSGSGKSTLLLCLCGLEEPDGGKVRIMGETVTRASEAEKTRLRRNFEGIVLQGNNLFDHLGALDNVRLAARLSSDRGDCDEIARELIGRVGLGHRMALLPSQLSGGERARASLAVALAGSPAILVLDEPTGEVDAKTESQILDLLDEHRESGGCGIIASHNEAVAAFADRTIRLKDGRISSD